MLEVMKLPFERVLCSHQLKCWARTDLEDYLSWLSPEVLDKANAVEMGAKVQTRRAVWEARGFEMVFDVAKRRRLHAI